ncbi:MAG: dienelactone hydrolase family protein [Pseudomonadota bacterium]|nr:dienelactone hydrolase family protein [Pseudomonadota bacterium]
MLVPFVLASSFVAPAEAAPRAAPVEWTVAGAPYSGFVVYDDASTVKRPGVVMIPNWMGVNAAAVEKAKTIAGTEYVVLLADVYGAEVRPADPKEASEAAAALYADRPALRARAKAAVDTLVAQAGKVPLDASKVGAIGFCFGGSAVLELARSGADLDAFVSFHGGLATPAPAAKGAVKGPVLVLNGAADANVKPEDIAAFRKEMTDAGADWQLVDFGGAVHCFAEPDANRPPNCLYDAKAARRAFGMMELMFDEAFAPAR